MLKKKIICLIAAMCLLLLVVPVVAFADEIEDATVSRGESIADSESTEKMGSSISGLPATKKIKARNVLRIKVTVTNPVGRKLKVQQYNSKTKKWISKRTVKTDNVEGVKKTVVTFPNGWWKNDSTKYRLVIAENSRAKATTSRTIKVKTVRYYQNPYGYLQIKNRISTHGYKYYTSPVLVNNASTRADHVNAMLKTAYKFLGDRYVVCQSRAPGKGVDCSGLVMQACYGAGADLWPSNPYRHRFPKYEYESRNIAKMKNLKTVSWKNIRKGDLIFYSKGGIVIHVAIYIGSGKIIHSWPGEVRISSATSSTWGYISKIKRVFI